MVLGRAGRDRRRNAAPNANLAANRTEFLDSGETPRLEQYLGAGATLLQR